ncbi:MAG: pilus assembly protein [Chloroflexi bacterium]|nr:pilus assembly protein [Chloroflexota bacterium]
MKSCIKILSGEKGTSAVEFAIILPILVMLVFGIIQFGLVFNKYIAITHAAREGARLAAVGLDGDPDFFDKVQNSAPTVTILTVAVDNPEGIKIGNPVEVTVTGESFSIKIPLVGEWSIPLTSTAAMRREQ